MNASLQPFPYSLAEFFSAYCNFTKKKNKIPQGPKLSTNLNQIYLFQPKKEIKCFIFFECFT